MKAFVTGGTGFIGGHLIKRLLRDGINVKALARDQIKADNLRKLGVEPVVGDITERNSIKSTLQGCDILYHLGNISSWWIPDKTQYYKVNVEGTRNIMLEALEQGVKKVIYTSSLATIRKRNGESVTEKDIEHARDFQSHYGRSKFLAEQEALRIHRESGLPVVILNPGVVIGPGDLKTFGRTLIELLNGELKAIAFEESVAPLVYIDDTVEAHILAAEKGRPGERYIIVGDNIKIGEIFKLVSKMARVPLPSKRISPFTAKLIAHVLEIKSSITGKPPKFAVDGVREMTAGAAGSNRKAKEELGIRFTPLEEALRKTINWYKENGYARF
ncbi:MAG TPA: NAD-dependent epimerase/dehydratase family protein [Thermodesulfobacteriota bacterium]|nr:NAD-dependent epimerase/dehydratase family protein [Thermodesulfobacteriota bacterium]